ncbi:hypothetical protein QTI59_15545 [Clostridium perfringens]|nr:hypothetical protein [Clostridium perfringens]
MRIVVGRGNNRVVLNDIVSAIDSIFNLINQVWKVVKDVFISIKKVLCKEL